MELGILIAVVVAMTQIFKSLIHVKYVPFLSLVLGIVAGLFYVEGDFRTQLLQGIIIGLSASGLYDQSKLITKKKGETP